LDGRTYSINSITSGVLMSNKKEIYNECYMCEQMYMDILDLINHIKTEHKEETGTQ